MFLTVFSTLATEAGKRRGEGHTRREEISMLPRSCPRAGLRSDHDPPHRPTVGISGAGAYLYSKDRKADAGALRSDPRHLIEAIGEIEKPSMIRWSACAASARPMPFGLSHPDDTG